MFRIMTLAAGTLFLAMAPTLAASHQPGPDSPAAVPEDLAEIRVVAARRPQEVPNGAGSHIDAQTLQRSRVLTVNEALRKVPGVVARDEEGLGLRPNIGIRGLNPTRSTKVLLLEDGLPLAFAPYGDNASYYHPPIERFERVEVLKGASQIAFGPQTIGGVINYVTRRPPESLEGALQLRGGNRGLLDLQLRVGDRVEHALGSTGWHLAATHKRSDGARDNMQLRIDDLALRIEQPLGETRSLTLRANLFREDSQVPYSGLTLAEFRADPRANPFVDDRFEIGRGALSATLGQRFGGGGELRTSLYYTYLDRDWWRQSSNSAQRPADASDPACAGLANLGTTCGNEGRLRQYATAGVETRWTQPLRIAALEGSLEAGARHHLERQYRVQVNGDTARARVAGTSVNGGLRENNEREVSAWSGYVAANLGQGRWRVTPGLRWEHVEFERRNLLAGGGAGRSSLDALIPGLGLSVELAPGHALFAGLHRGFAPPRVEDVIGNDGGGVELDAEQSWNAELGLRSTLRPGVELELTLFNLDFSNQIVPASVAGGTGATLTSAGRTRHSGAEFAARIESRPAAGTRWNAYARAALTWLPVAEYRSERYSSVPGFAGVRVTGNRLPYAPEHTATLGLGVEGVRGALFEVELVQQGSVFTDDLNTVPLAANGQRGRLGGHAIINVNAAQDLGASLTMYASVKNLTDRLYIADASRGLLPGTPRQFQFGVEYRF